MPIRLLPFFMLFPVTAVVGAFPPSSYPVVTQGEQQQRDLDRRAILEHELREERAILARAQAALAESPTEEGRATLHRHAENVKTLLREIDGVAPRTAARVPRMQRVVVRATRDAGRRLAAAPTAAPSFWNPYNRAPGAADRSLP